jgi:hypothetical protein
MLQGHRPRGCSACRSGEDPDPEKTAGTTVTVAVPDEPLTGARTVAAAPDVGATVASPMAAAADAPAARPATIAARLGERCRAGAAGATVGIRSDRTASGAFGMGGTKGRLNPGPRVDAA